MKYLIEDTNAIVEEKYIRKILLEEELGDIENNISEYLDKGLNIDYQCECIKKAINGDMNEVMKMLNESWSIPVKEIVENKYETVVIMQENISLEDYKKIQDKVKNILKDIENTYELGKKELAYEIKDNKYGWYLQYYWLGNEKIVTELQDYFRQEENIIKFITIKREVV